MENINFYVKRDMDITQGERAEFQKQYKKLRAGLPHPNFMQSYGGSYHDTDSAQLLDDFFTGETYWVADQTWAQTVKHRPEDTDAEESYEGWLETVTSVGKIEDAIERFKKKNPEKDSAYVVPGATYYGTGPFGVSRKYLYVEVNFNEDLYLQEVEDEGFYAKFPQLQSFDFRFKFHVVVPIDIPYGEYLKFLENTQKSNINPQEELYHAFTGALKDAPPNLDRFKTFYNLFVKHSWNLLSSQGKEYQDLVNPKANIDNSGGPHKMTRLILELTMNYDDIKSSFFGDMNRALTRYNNIGAGNFSPPTYLEEFIIFMDTVDRGLYEIIQSQFLQQKINSRVRYLADPEKTDRYVDEIMGILGGN